MVSINIRDVPADTHTALKRQARVHGLSLQRYLLALLNERASSPTIGEVLADARRDARRAGSRFTAGEIVGAVRAGRSERR